MGVVIVLIVVLVIWGFVNFRKLIVDDIELFLNFLRNDVLLECYCGLEYFKKIVSRSKVFFKLSRLY